MKTSLGHESYQRVDKVSLIRSCKIIFGGLLMVNAEEDELHSDDKLG